MSDPPTPSDERSRPSAAGYRASWPTSIDSLVEEQERLAQARPQPWYPPTGLFRLGGCFVCFPRRQPGPGTRGDPAWAAAVSIDRRGRIQTAVVDGVAGAPYKAGLLALREGPLLEAAVRALPQPPDLLLVNATGRDHPRRAGLALHLGAVLDLPTVGVTHRPLLATGRWPELERGARSALEIGNEIVGHWLCTRTGKRPVAVHAAWRTSPEVAATTTFAATTEGYRTPSPVRLARRAARKARAAT